MTMRQRVSPKKCCWMNEKMSEKMINTVSLYFFLVSQYLLVSTGFDYSNISIIDESNTSETINTYVAVKNDLGIQCNTTQQKLD